MAWRIVPGINQVDGRTIRVCGLCDRDGKQSTAEKYCMNCEVYLCIKCKNPHVRFSHGAHEIIDAKDVKEPPGVNDMKGYDKCQIHEDSFRFYCVIHEELCCSDCHIETHKLCEQVPKIELLALVEDALSADIEAEIGRINLRAKQAIKSLKMIKEDARHKRVSVEHLVDRIKLTLMQICDELKSQVSKNFRDVEEKLQRSADDQIPTFEIISCKMESLGNFVSDVKTNGTEVQTFIAGKQIRREIRETEQNINGHANIENVNTSIELCSSLSDLVVGCESLINFVEGTELIDCTTNQAIKAALLIPVASKILNKEAGDSEEPLYSGLDFFSDGRLAVVDNVNNSVHVLDETLQKRSTYKFENEVRHGYDVCVVADTEVAITTGYVLEILSVNKYGSINPVRSLTTTSQYYSICLRSETAFLVSTFGDNRPYRMVTLSGKEKNLSILQEKRFDFEESCCAYSRNTDTVVLTDKVSNTIGMYIYDSKGDFVDSKVVEDEHIRQPSGVSVGPRDILFVCSTLTNSVVQISPDGEFIASNKLDMEFPRTICVSKFGWKLAVTNSSVGHKKLQIFHLL